MPRASDLVHDSKLETKFIGHDTRHISYRSVASTQQRRVRVDELWNRKRKVGDGTYGRVWLELCSEGPKAGELRAVKEIPKVQTNKAKTDYTKELEAITKFSQAKYVHCFVQSFGWYEDDNSVYIAMEYMEHGDLQKRLTRPYPEVEVLSIASQLLEGLQFMHENGFTHRDLKPSNILVLHPSPDWWIKIGDFGISKRVEEGLTSLRTMVGTRGYLAPEVIGLFPITDDPAEQIAEESYTSAIDIWALGEICFKLIANRPAFLTPRELFNYVARGQDFPCAPLQDFKASYDCITFINLTMAASAANRPSAAEGLKSSWMNTEGGNEYNRQSRMSERQANAACLANSRAFEATAAWSTLSSPPSKTPTSSAPSWYARDLPPLPHDARQEARVSKEALGVYNDQNEPKHIKAGIMDISSTDKVPCFVPPLHSPLGDNGSASSERSLRSRKTGDDSLSHDDDTRRSNASYQGYFGFIDSDSDSDSDISSHVSITRNRSQESKDDDNDKAMASTIVLTPPTSFRERGTGTMKRVADFFKSTFRDNTAQKDSDENSKSLEGGTKVIQKQKAHQIRNGRIANTGYDEWMETLIAISNS
ncbi:hypothetical protein E8E14_009683 [Neopestalotiopsis sp. 37M]|nr:hypothetical protein E8E14_009683 [Neopestalotiopsis sp. 37M]